VLFAGVSVALPGLLLIQPRMEVIGDPQRLEASALARGRVDGLGSGPALGFGVQLGAELEGAGGLDSQPVRHVPGFVIVSAGSPGAVIWKSLLLFDAASVIWDSSFLFIR
jgi:hypothetical protein